MYAFLRNTPFDHATCPSMAFVILQATDVTFENTCMMASNRTRGASRLAEWR